MRIRNPLARAGLRPVLAGALALAVGALAAAVAVPASPAAAFLPGLFPVSAISAFNSDPSRTVVVTCPGGTNVVGMGGGLFGASGDVAVEEITPDLVARTVTVTAKEVDPYAPFWQVTAWAMCAPAPAGLVSLSVTSPSTSDDKSVVATCPVATTLLSIGYDVGNGFGEVLVNQIRPDGGAGIPATTATVSAYEDDVYAANWTVTAHLLCATAIAGQQVVTAATAPSVAPPLNAVAAICPAGQNATGGSVAVEPTPPGVANEFSVYEMLPFPNTPGPVNSVWAIVNPEDPVTYTWSERAFALCV